MSLSPFDSFKSRFVTYLLNFPRSKLFVGRTNSSVKIQTTLKTSRCLVPLFLIRIGALQYILVLSIQILI